jgi:DNA-binding GntR family transcriptional regulator
VTANEPLAGQSLADAVVGRLRTAISTGRYPPGERLVERRLAHEFGISHIPLREALARLTEEGLVERLPRRGARVASLTPRMLEEVSSLRVVLEQFVVRRLAGRFTPEARDGLQAIIGQMMLAAGQHDLLALHELDQKFHQRLWELTDNSLLVELSAQMRTRTSHFYLAAATSLAPNELRMHARSHQHLLDIIASGDQRAAEQAMQQHIEDAARRISKAQQDQKETA